MANGNNTPRIAAVSGAPVDPNDELTPTVSGAAVDPNDELTPTASGAPVDPNDEITLEKTSGPVSGAEVDPSDEPVKEAADPLNGMPVSEEDDFIPDRSDLDLFARGSNVGIAGMLGAPVDLADFILDQVGLGSERPVGGSKSLQHVFSKLGIAPDVGEKDPASLAGSVGKVVGETAGIIATGGAGAVVKAGRTVVGALRPGATVTETGALATKGGKSAAGGSGLATMREPATVTGRIFADIGKRAIQKPGRVATGEIVAATGAGAGGYYAEQEFPDSQAAKVIGEVLGGLAPTAAVSGAVVAATKFPLVSTVAIRSARAILRPFSKVGATERAGGRVQGSARKLDDAQAELDKPNEFGLTPSQQTGDAGLMALERAVIDSSEQLKGQSDEQIASVTQVIRESLADIGDGVSVEKTVENMKQAREYVMTLLDTRLRVAAQRADERIAELTPGTDQRQANLIAKQELENAIDDWHAQERVAWEAVDGTVKVRVRAGNDPENPGLQEVYDKMVRDTPTAQQEDIPTIARQMLGRDEAIPEGFEEAFAAAGMGGSGTKMGETTTVAELQGLRSKLLEEARKARSAEDNNKARLAGNLADAVLDTLSKSPIGPEWEAAVALSRAGKDRFSKGSVGRLLGTDQRRGARTAAELTLETTVGKGGPAGRVESNAILAAVDEMDQSPKIVDAIQDFLRAGFHRAAVKDGKFDTKAAQRFIDRNQDTLEEFEELGKQMRGAVTAENAAGVARMRAEGVAKRLNDPKVSRGAVFLREPLDDAMQRVFKNPEPDKVMDELVKRARKDPTGDSEKGLKSAFGDFLLERASSRNATVDGDFILSGAVLKNLLSKGPAAKMAAKLLSPEDMKRLNGIVDAAVKIEKASKAKAISGGIINDRAGFVMNTLASIAGARAGAALGTGTIQAPGYAASLFRRVRSKLTTDPAPRLIIDAMQDADLYEALLRDLSTARARREVRAKLNAWLAAAVTESGEEAPSDAPEVDDPTPSDTPETEDAPAPGPLNVTINPPTEEQIRSLLP